MAWSRNIHGNTVRKRGAGGFDALDFAGIVEQAYLSTARPDSFKTKKSFAPSGIGYGSGTCPRYWFMAFSGVDFEENTDALGMANMSNGTYVHERLQKLFESTDILQETEREVLLDSPPIRGFADLIINWEGNEVVGEIKSIKQENYDAVKRSMTGVSYHVIQVLIYMKALGIRDGFLMYENKNTNEFLVIPISMTPRNKQYADYIFEWMTTVHENWKTGVLPTRPFTKSSKQCKYCPIKKACWAGPAGEIDLAPLEVREQ